MVLKVILGIAILIALAPLARGEISACNRTNEAIRVAIGHYQENKKWISQGWFEIPIMGCQTLVEGKLLSQYFYLHVNTVDTTVGWSFPYKDKVDFCTRHPAADESAFVFEHQYKCNTYEEYRLPFEKFEIGAIDPNTVVRLMLGASSPDSANNQTSQSGVIQRRCIARWDTDHQLHAVEGDLFNGGVCVKMKRLEHCTDLEVTGPVNIADVAQTHIDACVNKALNNQKTRHLLELGVAVASDITVTKGAAISAKISDYVIELTNNTLECVKDLDSLKANAAAAIQDAFGYSVKETTKWVEWCT